VLELEVENGQPLTVLLSDFQYHPVTRDLLHADFLQIDVTQPVDVDVPFELTGKPAGVVLGGVLRQVFRKLPVRCLPERIPVKIEHDVTELALGEHVQVQELTLPEGVAIRYEPTRTVAGVVAPEKAPAEAEAAAAPGAAAAPAAEAPAEAAESSGT
jgi:large subunit ribosomal protein L25